MLLGATENEIATYRDEGRYKSKSMTLFRVKAKYVYMYTASITLFLCRAIKVLHLFFKHYCYNTNSVIYIIHFAYIPILPYTMNIGAYTDICLIFPSELHYVSFNSPIFETYSPQSV